jgi:hypothetical protein
MKAEIKLRSTDGELIIGYEGGDEFSYPSSWSDLKKCENVIVEKNDNYSGLCLIDDKLVHVQRELVHNEYGKSYNFTVL